MNILVAGNGKVGKLLTKKLSAEGHDVTIIDLKQDVLNATQEQYDVMALQGNCASMNVLEQAGVKKADLLIAVTGIDEINLLCCMTAHAMNNNIHTIARMRNPEYDESIYKMRDQFGLSMIVNPEKLAAVEMERLLKYPGFLHRDTFAKGRVELVELRIDENSRLCNVSLMDLNTVVKCKVLVCAVLRNGSVQIPSGNFVLQQGDRIYVSASTNELAELLKNLGIITHKVHKAIFCGGGKLSYYLAQQLDKSGIQIQLIEQNRERCVELSTKLPNVSVIHGDASDQALLESEGLLSCDALLTLTGLDEMNMIISLSGENRHVPQIITKVGHMDNHAIYENLPLGSVVCPRELCCNNIVRYVRAMQNKSGAALTVYGIADGKAEAMEFRADENTLNCGRKLRELNIKKNVLIACISHNGKTELPHGDSTYKVGDTLIVIANGDVVISQLNDIFA